MNKKLLLLLSIISFLASCDCGYRYSVFVENSTGTDLKVSYKSVTWKDSIQETIVLANNDAYNSRW